MKTSCLSSIICDFDMFIDLIANNLTESKRPDQPAYLFSWWYMQLVATLLKNERTEPKIEINQKMKHASPLDSALPPVSHVKSNSHHCIPLATFFQSAACYHGFFQKAARSLDKS